MKEYGGSERKNIVVMKRYMLWIIIQYKYFILKYVLC